MSYGPGVYGALAATAALLAWPAVAVAAERCARSAGRIVAVERGVEVAVGNGWRAVGLDQDLCVQDLLRTGPAGAGAIQLGDGTVLRVDQGTTLRVEGGADRRGFVVRLIEGVVSIFSRRAVALTVDTPFANAAVEGTEFVVAVASGRTRVAVFEGRVRVSNPQGELRLESGGVAVARAGEAPVLEVDIRPRDAVRWALYYPPVSPDLLAGRPEADLPPAVRDSLRLRREGRVEAALSRLDDVPARDALAEVLRAELSLASGRPDDAAAAIDRALARDPASGEALALRAVIAVARNDKAGALADARRAVELRPASAAARLALAYAQQADFDLDATRATLAEAARLAPADALVRARLAEIELARGNLRAARGSAAEAARLAPDQARSRLAEGFVALAGLNTRAAKAAFARAIELDSLDPQARLGQGLARIRDGDLEGGRADLELAVALDPGNALLRSYLGKAYLEERRGELAGDELAAAKELDPNDPTPWFYDAIRKQRENRPVEALRDLEEAIGRNDRRAVYRSRLLLDKDLATRATSLAQIYDDLGFEELGRNEAARALADDPGSAAAHRFLADLYQGDARAELARASEVLQAQLYGADALDLYRPSLAFNDLELVSGEEPFEAGGGEYTRLFERNGASAIATAQIGDDETRATEGVAALRAGRTMIGAGQFHYQTEGFRPNSQLEHDIWNVFIRTQITPSLLLQGEFRHRDTLGGDRVLRFDPDDFESTRKRSTEADIYRIGATWQLTGSAAVVLSAQRLERDIRRDLETLSIGQPTNDRRDVDDEAEQIEGQVIVGVPLGKLRIGGGLNRSHGRTIRNTLSRFDDVRLADPSLEDRDVDSKNFYADLRSQLSENLDLAIRLAYESVDLKNRADGGLAPGIGLLWRPLDGVRFRAVATRTYQRPSLVTQTLAPTELAGFNQIYDDEDAPRTDTFAVSVETAPSDGVRVGVEGRRRLLASERTEIDEADLDQLAQDSTRDAREEDRLLGFAYWTPRENLAVSLAIAWERYRRQWRDSEDEPIHVTTVSAPLGFRYISPSGWFGGAEVTWLAQEIDSRVGDRDASDDDAGPLVDLELGYRPPGRRATTSFRFSNILGRDVSYLDESFRSSTVVEPRFLPERTLLFNLAVQF